MRSDRQPRRTLLREDRQEPRLREVAVDVREKLLRARVLGDEARVPLAVDREVEVAQDELEVAALDGGEARRRDQDVGVAVPRARPARRRRVEGLLHTRSELGGGVGGAARIRIELEERAPPREQVRLDRVERAAAGLSDRTEALEPERREAGLAFPLVGE